MALAFAVALALRLLLPSGVIDPHGHGLERAAPFHQFGLFGPLLGEVVHGAAALTWSRLTVLPSWGAIDLWSSSTLLLALAVGVAASVSASERAPTPTGAFLALGVLTPLLRLAPTTTLVLASAAGWIATDALARRFVARGGRAAWIGLLCAAVWTMQTHLELMAWVPALVIARLVLDGRPALRELGARWAIGGVVVAGISLAPHLAHIAAVQTPGGHVSMLATLGDPARRPVVGLLGVMTGACLVLAALHPGAGQTSPSTRRWTNLAAVAVGVATVLGLLFDVWRADAGEMPWAETSVLMHRGFFPWVAVVVVGIGWLDDATHGRGPLRVWIDTTALLALLGVYAGSADNFSTWLREGAVPAAMLYPWAVAGLARLPGTVRAVAVVTALGLSRGALWTPLDTQQEMALADAAAAARAAGAQVHGLTSTDDEGFLDPSRVDLERRRRPHDLAIDPTLDDLEGRSLTALLAARDEAVGRLVLLDVACFRATATDRAIDAEALVMDGARAIAQGPKRQRQWERSRVARPDGALEILADAPCLGQPDAQACVEPLANGACRTYACKPDAQPDPSGWTNALCAAVRERFDLTPILEHRLAPWTVDAAWAAPLARDVPIGLYRVNALREAGPALEPTDAAR
ncbi:MAG: hypothetical protein RLZZ383_549 [Pseudomonadota bacterium]